MKKLKKLVSMLLSISLLSACTLLPEQADALQQSDDMRAVWISTVYSADYPSVKNDPEQQKQEFITKLEAIQNMGLHTVVVQVRPKADAFYDSAINPWSEILTGTQGQNPGYDPMAFMIEETHKRGMEFHAWMNPYRITTSGTDRSVLAENHPARLHPEWVLEYNNALYYDPAQEAVKQHICDSVAEVVEKYDVDAIHFDDYFYPTNYPLAEGESLDGQQANERRQHVNDMIQRVHDTIQAKNPEVAFGISPMGIWKNNTSDSTGSATKGAEGYYTVYGDVRTWIQNGYVDYIVPQIYWARGTEAADYETLLQWWSNEVKGTDVTLYIGQGIYKDDVAAEIGEELALNEQYGISGSFFFSLRDLLDNRQNCGTAVTAYYTQKDTQTTTPETELPETTVPEETLPVPDGDNVPVVIDPTEIVPAKEEDAFVSATTVLVDGQEIAFDAYVIQDFTYFKLRDIAFALNGTAKQFDTPWDEATRAIHLQRNTPYAMVGGELQQGDGSSKKAVVSSAAIYLEEEPVALSAYNIDGNTYFKLRDLGKLLDFGVTWNETAQTIALESTVGYTE